MYNICIATYIRMLLKLCKISRFCLLVIKTHGRVLCSQTKAHNTVCYCMYTNRNFADFSLKKNPTSFTKFIEFLFYIYVYTRPPMQNLKEIMQAVHKIFVLDNLCNFLLHTYFKTVLRYHSCFNFLQIWYTYIEL